VGKVPVILAVGMKEVEDRTVSMRRLGEKHSKVLELSEVVAQLADEATAPDLKEQA
jgi:threonyl-tRNA synthetase